MKKIETDIESTASAETSKEIEGTYKVIMLGDMNVGKTCIINRLKYNTFQNNLKATIGADILDIDMRFQDNNNKLRNMKLIVIDTCGQERFNTLPRQFFRDVDAAVIVYDITSEESVDNVT